MPEFFGKIDYLGLHRNISRRVSNLETGEHPVRSEGGYDDVYTPTAVVMTSTIMEQGTGGVTDVRWKWQRRMGLVSSFGQVQFKTGKTHADLPAEEVLAVLPGAAKPTMPLVMRGQMSVDPWFFRYRIDPDGTVTLIKPSGPAAGGTYRLYFENCSWAAIA
jgi:hypothetical protein